MRRVYNSIFLAVALYGFAAWVYVAATALAQPQTLPLAAHPLRQMAADRYVRRAELCAVVRHRYRLSADARSTRCRVCARQVAALRKLSVPSSARRTRAGTPPTRVFAGTSLVTIAPAATTAPAPTVTPRKKRASSSNPRTWTDRDRCRRQTVASPPSGVANLMSHGENQDVRTETSLVADRDRPYRLR